ncbi:MAG TPA: response regulator [Candidatus Aquilonibacter sp.]|nr:response regulator [Candidatus Aquilonibacter sp.]
MPSILVADDNTNIQKMVSLAFEDRGITVVAVGNGEAAVRRIPDLNPDLVLADIFMPVRNGYEVCEFVKKDQRFSHVPVILLVGAFDPLDEKEARRVGADGVLKKPFVPPDPLIAMVISALEKNPRIAAELAKAKAPAAAAPVAAEEAAAFEVQSLPKPEPKPLPEFPEPTPEEAAVIYGFGKGVRAIDDAEENGAAKESAAPAFHRDQENDEDSEGAATATDWRRNAMDFEIPEGQGNRPAFSTLDDLESPHFFPSEAEKQSSKQKFEAPVTPVAAAPEAPGSVTPLIADEVDVRALEPLDLPVPAPVERAPIGFAKESEPAAGVAFESGVALPEPRVEAPSWSEPEWAPETELRAKVEPGPEPQPEPEMRAERVHTEPAHEESAHEEKPSFASRMRHWMDTIVSPPSHERPHEGHPHEERAKTGGDWMAALSEPPAAEGAPVERASVSPAPVGAAGPVVARPSEESFFAQESESGEPVHEAAAPETIASAEPAASQAEAAAVPEAVEHASESETREYFSTRASEARSIEVHEPVEALAHVPKVAAPEPSAEIWERAEETTPSLRDPELVVPEAVHVTPEPLLMGEDSHKSGESHAQVRYGAEEEEVHAAHSFEVPVVPEPAAEEDSAEESAPARPSFEMAEAEAAVKEERVPTGPPPNRQALAEIPFLNPPPDFDPGAHAAPAAPAVDSSTVDAVVQKVLEKLQPQLQDLLSQGVLKPLVENLLQQEAKKEK